jgi:hypothetical protein
MLISKRICTIVYIDMYQTFKKNPELAALPILILLGVGFFAATNPERLPPALLLIGFIIVAGILYSGLRLAARLLGVSDRIPAAKLRGMLIGATVLPVMMLALQSLGQLTPRDTITLLVLFVAGYFYISRMPKGRPGGR